MFGTTIDFLVMGDTETKAKQSLSDAELINQFKKISALPAEEKNLVLKMITAYIRDFNTQQAYASLLVVLLFNQTIVHKISI